MARYDQCDDTCTTDCGHCKGAGRPAPQEHDVTVRYKIAWDEFLAECGTCKWVGSYMPSKRLAEAEAVRHQRDGGES